ncbi:MAG: hypothetical protein JWO97_899 [Acidobacteria bacterium]|nr:hypothetical protein [Acidobacteriota bacterium]
MTLMRYLRAVVVLAVVLLCVMNPPVALAECPGVMCGGVCNLQGYDFCIYVMSGDETMACRQVGDRGCASMHSVLCCPRDPQA